MSIIAQEVYQFFPEPEGWEKSHEYPVYTPEVLWDYINGAAEGYLGQEFIDLHIGEYSKGNDVIRVEIYRHPDPSYGFGIYSQERSPDYHFIDIGTRGYHEGSSLNFVNDEYYVKVFGSSENENVMSSMEKIARLVSEKINVSPSLPEGLSRFPSEGKIPHTESFVGKNYLGHAFLNRVFTADYQSGEESFSMFIILSEYPEEILNEYLTFTKQIPAKTEGRITIQDPYNGELEVLVKDNCIYGITGTEDKEIAEKYLSSF